MIPNNIVIYLHGFKLEGKYKLSISEETKSNTVFCNRLACINDIAYINRILKQKMLQS